MNANLYTNQSIPTGIIIIMLSLLPFLILLFTFIYIYIKYALAQEEYFSSSYYIVNIFSIFLLNISSFPTFYLTKYVLFLHMKLTALTILLITVAVYSGNIKCKYT